MSGLKERIARLIGQTGPISVADYMAVCLFDPQAGYYTTREPFGAAGDFTTAPEVSQMFGELIGVWAVSAWRALGAPAPFLLVEIGPGRGTLMADMARTISKLDPVMAGQMDIAMVEASPRLAAIQRAALAAFPVRARWFAALDELPEMTAVFVANELFDAVPVRQFVKTGSGWRERVVGLDADGGLAFMAGAAGLDPALLPPGADDAPEGAICELSPARSALMATIAAHIAGHGGAGLFIDYGYGQPALGDSLQAVRAHAYAHVLDEPGATDLTAHVDFHALAGAARAHGLGAGLASQGAFLLAMGLAERADALGAKADGAVRERLRGEAERLTAPEEMGALFKVLMVGPAGAVLPPSAAALT